MKKIIIFALVAFAAVTSAIALSVFQTDQNVRAYTMHDDTWYLLPAVDSRWHDVYNGDLVADSYTNYYNSDPAQKKIVDREMVMLETDFKYAYVYDAVAREYILIHKNGENLEIAKTIDYNDVSRYPVMWVYPKVDHSYGWKQYWFEYHTEKMPTIDTFTIKAGWNFIYTTPDMVGLTLDDWTGTCNVIDFAAWEDEENKWSEVDTEEMDEWTTKAKEIPFVAAALAVKVTSDCKFKADSVPDVPGLPE